MGECRFCKMELKKSFCDLGMSPLSNSYVKKENINKKENFYPLHVYVCEKCFLVQLEEFESPEHIFSDYAYFSSFSDSWLKHAQTYTQKMIEKLKLTSNSLVMEIASNDGYLLQYFHEKKIKVLGVEPAANIAEYARKKGIHTEVKFFDVKTATELKQKGFIPDLLLGNNVLAHVPDINDFVKGMALLLKNGGTITMEFPHLLRMMEENQYDTIYHEHFSYLSLLAVNEIFTHHELKIFDVEELNTHGGSLRIYATHVKDEREVSCGFKHVLEKENMAGFKEISTYLNFSEKVKKNKREALRFLIDAKTNRKKIVGYGAPAKGNTFLNYCGIGTDFLDYTMDKNPHKQNTYLPGSHIPVYNPAQVKETKPDYVVILPWNLKSEISEQLSFIREWGGQFVTFIPEVRTF